MYIGPLPLHRQCNKISKDMNNFEADTKESRHNRPGFNFAPQKQIPSIFVSGAKKLVDLHDPSAIWVRRALHSGSSDFLLQCILRPLFHLIGPV